MARTRGCLFLTLLMVMLLGSSAWAASISGTVTNNTGKIGRIYLKVNSQNGGSSNFGTSISGADTFTINGVQQGTSYTVEAFVDTHGIGVQYANDPRGTSKTVTTTSGNVTVGTFSVSPPASVSLGPDQAPQVMVFPGSGANFMLWDGPQDDSGLPIADKYTVSWSSNASGLPLGGTQDVLPSDKEFFAHIGGSSALYYRVAAVAGGTSVSSPWTQVPAATGTGSVTGKVYFPGVTATGPLLVVLVDESANPPKFQVVAVTNPVSGGTFTATKVPPGTYSVYPILDQNNSGTYDAGDISPDDNSDFSAPRVTVSTSQVTAPDVTLVNDSASVVISTNHSKGQWGDSYNLDLKVGSMRKQVVKVRVTSGGQLATPMDIARDGNSFSSWNNLGSSRPTVGDSYSMDLTYSDGSVETVTKTVTAVLDAFATPLAPVGNVPFNPTPTFSWTAPSPAPAEYIYSIWMSDNNGNNSWDAWGVPSGTTSIVYGSQGDVSQSELTDGTTYNWNINVTDRNGNQASSQVSFTPSDAPVISGFSPAGGVAGNTVTITGLNFTANPSLYTVLFHGVTATVSAATSTSLTVKVPEGATTGRIQVNAGANILQSATDFIVAAPATFAGVVKTSANVPIAGARVEKDGDATIYTTTAADGSFTLQGLFQNQGVALKISKSGYVPTYTADYYLQANLDLSPYPSHLYTQAELASWGVVAGKGAVVGMVLNSGTTPYSPVGGAFVIAQSNGIFYPVTYYSGLGLGGASTYANGVFVVANVPPYNWVSLDASKSSWYFQGLGLSARADSVSEGGLIGNTQPPYFSQFSPTSGKAGTSVVLTGGNFSSVFAENSVKFNGVTATVTAATPSSLTVTVPAGATTGPISITTEGGTATMGYWDFIMHYTLSASVAGSGGALGTMTSVPVFGISCRGTSGSSGCTADFAQGAQVNIIATADGGSTLSAWGGACTGTGTCSFSMDADKTVSAAFAALQYIKNNANYFSLLKDAFAGAANASTIQAQAQVFTDSFLVFNRPATLVTLKGGYDGTFQTNGGYTTLDGRLNLQGGTLRVEKLKVK